MTEAREQTAMQAPILRPNQFEISVPRKAQGERIGTGAIAVPLRPGLPGETVRGEILKTIFHATRNMQAPCSALERHMKNPGSIGRHTDEELAQFEGKRQQGMQIPERAGVADNKHLLEADKQQAEKALETTRSALQEEIAAQAKPAKSQPQERNEGAKQRTERKAQKEQETEPVEFYSTKDGHLLFKLQLPKGGKYTTADVNRALQAAGYDFTYSPAWTPGGWRMRGRDIGQAASEMWQILKQLLQAIAQPELMQE